MFSQNLVPYSPYNQGSPWGRSPYTSRSRNQMRNSARLMAALRGRYMGSFGNSYGRQPHFGGFGYPRMPSYGRGSFSSYPNSLARRGLSTMNAGYGMRASPFRNPYLGSGLRSMGGYGRSPWGASGRHSSHLPRGYPPSAQRCRSHASQWYDEGMSDEEEDDDYNPYYGYESDDECYGSTYGRQRSHGTEYDYDDNDGFYDDDDDDDFMDEDYYNSLPRHGRDPYGS